MAENENQVLRQNIYIIDNYNDLDFNTNYSDDVTTWSTSVYNVIPLNAQAKTDMIANSRVSFAVINYDFDYKDVSSTSVELYNGSYFTEQGGTGHDPELGYSLSLAPSVGPLNMNLGELTLKSGLVTVQ